MDAMNTQSPERRAREIAMVWRGDPDAAQSAHPRLQPIAEALADAGLAVVHVLWSETQAGRIRGRLLASDGVLVWVDPLTNGQDRVLLDEVLREVARKGVWVSAHPNVILKMGVKEVLVRTKSLGWGVDTHGYADVESFRREFPPRLAADGVRVLKQNRGNSNQGVWKVMLADAPEALVDVIEARGDVVERGLRLGDFMARCEAYLDGSGRIVDQAFQRRVDEGLTRCYMSRDRVIGFCEQTPRSQALGDPGLPTFGMASAKTFHPVEAPKFENLRRRMEREWTPGLQALLGIETRELPVLWDADFLKGVKTADGEDSYVLCEINVSCVIPFPPEAPAAIVAAVTHSLDRHGRACPGHP
jgi:hypothetical protein